jgi:hypothetical protein
MRQSMYLNQFKILYDLRLIPDYLGHRDPKHTTRYTRTAASRFEGLGSP